ncbi:MULTISPECIES: rhodanese-like domain-containing protein [unclassified Synechocystis]|uniref:rhodanese-like domain-containing protein n=1 Tax=unclassified Synechocystis TaxID=2640012 RepID=UPI00048CD2E8|nr:MULTISPECIES: rhodanese-like domain-containing protein [unclassified Synechocystis]MCT0253076.1 rhodanese [Synechocystis sp. CS-94]
MTSMPSEISVQDLALMLADPSGDRQLIDVREPHEVEIAALPGFETLSLSCFAQWSGTIQERYNPDKETVVLCHHGIRSDQMAHWLVDQGFSKVKNVVGGIDAYSRLVDATIPRY